MFTALAVRLALFIDRYAVNLLYLDEWDFLHGLFEGADFWSLFRWQHGLQRQGLGNLITAVVLGQTGWNSKAVAAASAATMVLAGVAALWLVRRVCGRLRAWDIAVPFLFVTTTIVDSYVITPNLAHGPLPALYLMAYGLALTVDSHVQRAVLITAINFLAVNTGFTVLLGVITPVVLLLSACRPGLPIRDRAVYGTASAASVATLAHFARGLVWAPAVTCFAFPHQRPWEYVPFVGRVIARPFDFRIVLPGETLGITVAVAAAAFTMYAVFRALRSRGNSVPWNLASVLMGFTLVFAVVTAVGRVCTGIPAADSARYIPYVLPGLLAVYLVLRCGPPSSRWQTVALALFVSACVLKEASAHSRREANFQAGLKRAWHDCYLSIHDIETCNVNAGRAVYPAPEATNLQQKLDWLEKRGYNLFQDRERP